MKFKSFSTKLIILLAAVAAFAFEGDDNPIEFYLSTNRIYAPGDEGIGVEFSGRVDPRATVAFRAFRIEDPVGFFLAQQNPHSPGSSETEEGEDTKSAGIDLSDARTFVRVAAWSHRLTSRDKYWQYESVPVPLKEKGVYLVEATVGGKSATTALVITELGMIVKQSNSEVLAFVVKRKSGERVTGLPITFARGPKKKAESRTGDDGVAQIATSALPAEASDEGGWDGGNNQLLAIGAKDGNFVISDSYFNSYYGRSGASAQIYLHTDRPVYRPAQTVYYRGIVRGVAEDGTYENVTSDTAKIEVTDARGGSIKKDTLALSDMGTFSGEILLGDEPPLGSYSVTVTVGGGTQSFTFDVEEYKKPEYEVTVQTDRAQYTRGDKIHATVNAMYYFGSPVAEGEVQYSIFRTRYWRPWWWRSGWAYLYEGNDEYASMRGMQMISSGRGKLDTDGKFTIDYQTDRDGEDDYVYRIQANVVDASRRTIAGATSVKVTRGEFYVTAQTGRYIYKPAEEARVNVETMAFDGDKPVSAPFDVKVERTWWEDYGKRRGNGNRSSETVWQGSGVTDGNGTGSAAFTLPKAGYYTITVTAKDSRGTKIATSTSVYVSDGSYSSWYNDGGDVQIIPDKDLYKPGETMSALVIMPAANIDALITAEGPTIYRYQVERLSSTSVIIRMPIEGRYAPMFYIAASSIANESFYSATKQITVAPQGKVLTLEVTTDRSVYKPGEKGTVTVRALDDRGEPVGNTDIAVGMVDEAIYAIHPDNTPEIQKFFYSMRWNQVSTNTSLNFSFYARARRMLARGGRAEMSMANEDAMAKAAPAAAPQAFEAKDDESGLVQPTIRSDFKDLMYWTPSVRTDGSGYAKLDVSFPDNLTTWRITARGVTRATAVGQTTASVIARKDLLVRMETPRFITQGDELLIATTVHNYLSSEKRTKVVFAAEGVELTEREKTVVIPADGEQRIDWKIKAPKIGSAKLTVKALTDEESDAMELVVPILPLGVRSGASALADMDENTSSQTLTLTIPENSDPKTGELTIALAPSAASSILGALDELIGYPYGCVEQTMSRFLPTVVVADALKKLDVPFDPKKREELPKMVAKGLNRLYGLQHDDGGWGWWEHDETNPFMTAYVMYGMTAAIRAGYEVTDDRYNRGVAALRNLIEIRKGGGGMGDNDKKLDATTEAYMLYVASFIAKGSPDKLYTGRIETLSRRSDINNYGQALLALAAFYQNDRSTASRLADKLSSNATTTSSTASWSGKTWHYNWQDDQVETSAFAVKALLEIKGENDLVRRGIHYLLAQKKGNAWENTRQTSMVIYALVDYIKGSRELDPNYTLSVRVNGREIYSKRITRANIFAPEEQVKVDRELLKTGGNVVTIEKSGSGRLYASARLSYFATGAAIRQADAGFKVERTYYTLRRERKNGAYVYAKTPYNGTVKSGDELLVKVKIVPSARYEYFLLEDPLPAGCEVVANTDGYTIPGEDGYGGRPDYGYYRMAIWNWWYADRDVRDEKVAFFAREMETRTYEFSYIMRAQIPGRYAVMPAVGMLMYYPEVRGNSNALAMSILE